MFKSPFYLKALMKGHRWEIKWAYVKFNLLHLTKYIVNNLKCGFQVKVTFVLNNRETGREERQTHFANAVKEIVVVHVGG